MFNKDFLKDVLAGRKLLLSLKEVKWCKAPDYDELGVTHIYPLMKDNPRFSLYMPTKLPKGRFPCREFFWNVMNTYDEEYTQNLFKHSMLQRNSANNQDMQKEAIQYLESEVPFDLTLREREDVEKMCIRVAMLQTPMLADPPEGMRSSHSRYLWSRTLGHVLGQNHFNNLE